MPHHIQHRALAPLKEKFPQTKFLVGAFRDMVTVVVPREALVATATFLRDDPSLRYDMLVELNGVDYLNFPGATHRFGVNYGLLSIENNNRLWLKVFLDPTRDTVPGHDGAILDSRSTASAASGWAPNGWNAKPTTCSDSYSSGTPISAGC